MSKRGFTQKAKSTSYGFTRAVIEHPWGQRWAQDQQRSSGRRVDGVVIEPTPIVPGISAPRQWAPVLPEKGVVGADGAAIRQIVNGRWSDAIVAGFPAALNRACSTPEEVEALRVERLEWSNENLVKVATARTGRSDLNIRPAKGALEQCYGLLGLDVTLAWRFAAKAGLNVEPRLESVTKYGEALLRRVFGVVPLASYYHPANPYEHQARGGYGGGEWEELGFGSHIQFKTARTLGGVWLTEETDFRRVGPATVSGKHLVRLKVDVHAHARARHEADQTWLYESSTGADWQRQKLTEQTISRVQKVQAAVAAGTMTVAEAVAQDVARWDASWAKSKKTMPDVLKRNVATASKHQRPVDWVLSERVTAREIRELLADPVWRPFYEKAKRAAVDIETANYKGGFRKSLSQLLFEWERADEAEGLRAREVAIKATAAKEIGAARDAANVMIDKQAAMLKRAGADMKLKLSQKDAEAAALRAQVATVETDLDAKQTKAVRLAGRVLPVLKTAATWLHSTQRPEFSEEPTADLDDYVEESASSAWGWAPTKEFVNTLASVVELLPAEATKALQRIYRSYVQFSDSSFELNGRRLALEEIVDAVERLSIDLGRGEDEFLLDPKYGGISDELLRHMRAFEKHPKFGALSREVLRLAKIHEERRTEVGKQQVRDEFKRPPEAGDAWRE